MDGYTDTESGSVLTVSATTDVVPSQEPELEALLRYCLDVFESIPSGLPPDRGTGHTILLSLVQDPHAGRSTD